MKIIEYFYMEPDYGFVLTDAYGELIINFDCDYFGLMLDRKELDHLSDYIRRKLHEALNS